MTYHRGLPCQQQQTVALDPENEARPTPLACRHHGSAKTVWPDQHPVQGEAVPPV